MTQAGASDAGATGLASESRWILPGGFDCLELAPEARDLPPEVADVRYPQFFLRPGLEVYTFAAKVRSPVALTYEVLSGEPYLWLALNFAGRNQYLHETGLSGAVLPDSSHCAMFRDPVSTFDYSVEEHRTAGMAVTPARLAEMLQGQRLCRSINDFLDGSFDPAVLSSRPTAALRTIAEQMGSHPYHGVMETVFLEGKAFEMLAESLSTFFDDGSCRDGGLARRHALAAREIMMADLAHPPRIEDVALAVGLSQRRLNEVFRDVFEASPLQCLVRWRLDLARQLLASGELSVKQVAHRLGYAHVSNFSLAFTRRFGHPPSSARDRGRTDDR